MFKEQYRLTEGIIKWVNETFYGGEIKDADITSLTSASRALARAAVALIDNI